MIPLTPRSIAAMAGGIAILAVGVYIAILHHRIANLERANEAVADRLAACQKDKAVIDANREALLARIDELNAVVEQRRQEASRLRDRLSAIARTSADRQREIRERLANDLAAAASNKPSSLEEKVKQCEQARLHLVQPSS